MVAETKQPLEVVVAVVAEEMLLHQPSVLEDKEHKVVMADLAVLLILLMVEVAVAVLVVMEQMQEPKVMLVVKAVLVYLVILAVLLHGTLVVAVVDLLLLMLVLNLGVELVVAVMAEEEAMQELLELPILAAVAEVVTQGVLRLVVLG
jgi:hypothetical protein